MFALFLLEEIDIIAHQCVAAFLLNRLIHKNKFYQRLIYLIDYLTFFLCYNFRAFSKFEFVDVRKLAAELCGRIHPQVSRVASLNFFV